MTRALPWLGAALALVTASMAISWWLQADHVVASLLSPGGLTPGNLLLALTWVVLRLGAVLGAPALIAVAGVRALSLPEDGGGGSSRGRSGPDTSA
jgi:hypothetical protein